MKTLWRVGANPTPVERSQMPSEKELEQMAAAEKQADRENAIRIAEIKANADLQKTTLQAIGNESSYDPNADLTDKLIAQKELALKENQANAQNALQQSQLTNQLLDSFNKKKLEEQKMQHDKKLKQDDAKAKKEVESQKLKQVQEQNKNQIELANKKHESDMAIANKQLEMKKLEKQMKELELKNKEKVVNLE